MNQPPSQAADALLFFVKNPEPGRVKTRMASTVGPNAAAAIYRSLTSEICAILPPNAALYVHFDPPDKQLEIQEWLTPMLPSHAQFIPQIAGDLGDRMRAAFQTAFSIGHQRVAIIGSDCIDLSDSTFTETWRSLETCDCVLGPCSDGGYYLLAMNRLHPILFENIPWSSLQTLPQTLHAASSASLKVHLLPMLDDIDTEADLLSARNRHPRLFTNRSV